MPIPKPNVNETEDDFIERFMSDDEMEEEYPDEDQRMAIAYDVWEDSEEKSYIEQFETKKYDDIDFKPTTAMAKAAKRGLEMRSKQPKSNRGGTAVGLARARQLINRIKLSPSTVKRMYSFLADTK